jgi:hypothetical protein
LIELESLFPCSEEHSTGIINVKENNFTERKIKTGTAHTGRKKRHKSYCPQETPGSRLNFAAIKELSP